MNDTKNFLKLFCAIIKPGNSVSTTICHVCAYETVPRKKNTNRIAPAATFKCLKRWTFRIKSL